MIELRETIYVNRTPREAFDYLADFTTTVEWDATAREAVKETPGPVALGTRFRLDCALPLGSVDVAYEVVEFEPPRHLVLAGSSRLFAVTDSISLVPDGDATRIDYRARFELGPLLQPFADALRPGLERMGRTSIEGLRLALEDRFPAPDDDPALSGADRLLLPRLARFTRLGYRRSRKHWHPVSASLSGRHALVTGGSSGLGTATAMELARRGARLTLVMRDPARAEQVRAAIEAETGNGDSRVELADLSLLREVDALCARLQARGEPLDVLVNNAGALYREHAETDEGIERSLALLLLSPYRLTLGLRPLLRPDARIINVVSGGLYSQRLSLPELISPPPGDYSGPVAYARAKRALMTVTEAWAKEWRKDGIAVNAMHPGWADTPGLRASLPRFYTLTRPLLRSPEQGADTIVWLAAAREAGALSGRLLLDREVQPLHLLPSTRESAAERAALLEYLHAYDPPRAPGVSRARRARA